MDPGYKVLTASDVEGGHARIKPFAIDVLVGLSAHPKRLPSRYIYDDAGSDLFSAICELDAYYPTRTEHQILVDGRSRITDALSGRPFNLVDLGAGDGRKSRVLIDHFKSVGRSFCYVPIDISEGAMRGLVEKTQKDAPGVHVQGLVSEYMDGIAWLSKTAPERQNLVMFLGSNIGNFSKGEAKAMLLQLWNAARPGDIVLIGFDLKKDIDVLLRAYNDEEGVTAAFNKNLLHRINNELGADFNVDRFRHFSTYNVFSGAMESYLVSLDEQTVTVRDLHASFHFNSWEPIHTEYSYKYLVSDVEDLARETGFTVVENLYDEKRYFLDAVWRVEKPDPRLVSSK